MTVRLDSGQKVKFDALWEQFGMSANAAIKVFINAVVRTRSIPFKVSAELDEISKRALEALYAPHPETPEMTLDEINEEIRAARRERKERLERERQQKDNDLSACGNSGADASNP